MLRDDAEIERLRAMTPAERIRLAMQLSDAEIRSGRAEIAREHPEWDERRVAMEWAKIHYGESVYELIDRMILAEYGESGSRVAPPSQTDSVASKVQE